VLLWSCGAKDVNFPGAPLLFLEDRLSFFAGRRDYVRPPPVLLPSTLFGFPPPPPPPPRIRPIIKESFSSPSPFPFILTASAEPVTSSFELLTPLCHPSPTFYDGGDGKPLSRSVSEPSCCFVFWTLLMVAFHPQLPTSSSKTPVYPPLKYLPVFPPVQVPYPPTAGRHPETGAVWAFTCTVSLQLLLFLCFFPFLFFAPLPACSFSCRSALV